MLDTASPPSDHGRESASEQAELARVLESCLAELEAGRAIDRERLLAEHPAIADRLESCLATLAVVQQAAAGLGKGLSSENLLTPAGRLGDFDILRQVGRGGMGVVYEARQISLGRRVALKVLPFAATLDPRQLQRFWTEAQAAAILNHPHIVPVYSVGCERGVHYYAMQFIEGQTLAEALTALRRAAPGRPDADAAPSAPTVPAAGLPTERSARGPGYFQAVARLGMQAALALEHAHQLGVVHRDIKPANLLLDARGNVWVTDFGLARVWAQAGLTLTGDTVGTLRYMSPEQALAKRALVDHRTDIYSLGATLYEALTLQPAYPGDDREELLRRIAQSDPPPPRRINRAVPVDLETVILKSMAREPERRYATAQDLADDLGRFLEHRPVRAVRPSVRERVGKWAWRHRSVLTALAVVGALATGGLLTLTVLLWRAQTHTNAALDLAQANGALAEANFRKALGGLNELLWELENPQWAKIPGFLEARHELTRKGLRIFQDFVDEPGTDPAVRFQAARAHEIMVNVYLVEHRFDEARQAHGKAAALFEGLIVEQPENPDYYLVLARTHAALANWDFSFKRHEEAKTGYRRAADVYRRGLPYDRDGRVHSQLAFLLCDCQETELRDPIRALALAMHALSLVPQQREFWITVGLAHYRVGEWPQARAALEKAMALGAGGGAHEWLLLALIAWRQGERAEARAWYDKAAAWLETHPMTDTLYHFRKEAVDVMGVRWP
jgi:serine/threonine protein kinase